jgi:hypothetical protein
MTATSRSEEEQTMSSESTERRPRTAGERGADRTARTPGGRSGRRRRARGLLALALLGALLVCAAAAAAKAPVKGAKYTGVTSSPGSSPVTFAVSANGKRILKFTAHLGYNGKCGQGGGPTYEVKAGSIPIRAGGKFSATTKGTLSGTALAVKPVTVKISGRISGRTAIGSVVEPGGLRCKTTHKGANSYSATFTAKAA